MSDKNVIGRENNNIKMRRWKKRKRKREIKVE